MTSLPEHPGVQLQGLEARLGARVAALLNERTEVLPHDIEERLRVARDQALMRARSAARAARAAREAPLAPAARPDHAVRPSAGLPGRWFDGRIGARASAGETGFWLGLASWMPLLVLVLGLVLIRAWTTHEQVLAAAEIDTLLLADELPPAAWSDPGFREFLKTSPL
ncbi:MAG TPA: DUF3619 family protein [Rubrivivax sp.]|nr:DUF3619 family protein [Rubrivivax sp.]